MIARKAIRVLCWNLHGTENMGRQITSLPDLTGNAATISLTVDTCAWELYMHGNGRRNNLRGVCGIGDCEKERGEVLLHFIKRV